ncbi:RNA polymerase sigma factor [bacterium]|nr:RNA polymerase sigma factor [bacterium]
MQDETYELIRQSKEGDMQAFRQLMEQYQQYAYQLAYHILHCQEDARDTVQETFIRVWQHLSRFNIKKKFTAWLYRIVVNQSLDKMRQKKRRSEVTVENKNDSIFIDPQQNPEDCYMNKEMIDNIRQAMDHLPLKQRLVFILRDLQHLSVKEVAKVLRCTHQSVKSNLYYARRNMRNFIENNEGVL